jgi:serine protease
LHVIGLEKAFAYSQSGNGSSVTDANALGSSSVKIAIIDTGEDTTHPELHGKITYQKCFITNPSNVQSTSNFTTDPLGHGTDVSGIAAADNTNALGFTGAGGRVVIYGYRIFPTPDDSCASSTSTSLQCGADTGDIASAIYDAIQQHVNVISMSLGGGRCTNGVDSDATEGNAVAAALAANIVVVAAAGNDGSSPLEAPACNAGVIAVGASALGDGQVNGSGTSVSTEYVASYSDWGSPAASPKSTAAWGIVAPGGDPACATASNCDSDNLHWIENIWTSQPYMASAGDTTFAGACGNDYPNASLRTTPDCRTEIAGTSMATPHVAGVAALILSVNSSYQSPAMMKQLLCTTADDIGDPHEGCGRLNAYRAMATALHDPILP